MTISPGSTEWVPDACTLPTVQQPIRIAEFDRFFTDSTHGLRRAGPTRLELLVDPAAEPLARDLAARELSCCSFFTFDFAQAGEHLVMGLAVPSAYIGVLDAFATRAQTAIGGGR
ncbi:hypothetical protein [Nocardia neocaledoniensis]|uniref:hypothetical protein n=1 Tax=Nocardia neocaledoniensis TaxID=236511 RepID=UPI0024585A06|nr:hypothetical protein [Nocardia neocaledoniensis]